MRVLRLWRLALWLDWPRRLVVLPERAEASTPMWTETTPQMFFPGFLSVGASSTTNVWAALTLASGVAPGAEQAATSCRSNA